MAIYHLSVSIVKRSAGRSVTAAAAYRAATKIEDITTGLVHDYTRKKGVDHSEIISPISASSGNEWLTNRQELWNKIEEVEKRKDAQLAREVTIALPCELPRLEQIALVREYVQTNYVNRGMIADVNLHHLDGDNPHAHILLSMRDLQTSPEGKVEFGLKNTDWNSKELLLTQRKSWEEITNKYLVASGSDLKIDCRSLKDQGSEFIPQIHVGVHAMAMKRKGIATDRGEEFDRIEAENNDIRTRLERIYEEESVPEPEPEPKSDKDDEDHRIGELVYQNIKSYKPINSQDNNKKTISIDRYIISKNVIDSINVQVDNGSKLLSFKLENEKWVKTTFYPGQYSRIEYSKNDIDKLVEGFSKVVDNFSAEVKQERNRNRGENKDKENQLGESIYSLLEKWGQRIFHPEDIGLTFYLYKSDQLSVYAAEGQHIKHTRIYSLRFIDDGWIEVKGSATNKYSIDTLTTLVNNQHDRFTTGEIKQLELNHRELKEIRGFEEWRGLELNDHRLAEIRENSVEIITTDLAKYLAEWIKEHIPETDYILTGSEIREIKDNSSDSIIFINNEHRSSVYSNYIILDRKEDKVLDIRYNRGNFENIYGVMTPAISERIKDIISDFEPIIQKQELIPVEVININLKPVTTLLSEKVVEKIAAIETKPLPPKQEPITARPEPRPKPPARNPISEGDPRVHMQAIRDEISRKKINSNNNQDLIIKTPSIIVQEPEIIITKLPAPDEASIQIRQQQLEQETTKKQRLANLVKSKELAKKSQAKKHNRDGR